MKAHLLWLFTVINLVLLVGSASAHTSAADTNAPLAAPVGTAFIYQGRLRTGTAVVNRSCDFQFSLWNAASAGTRIGGVLSTNGVAVTDGRFSVSLDFGAAAFDGQGRWLQVAVRCPTGGGGFTTLAPRQALAPAPYATRAATASSVSWASITGKPAGFADNVDNTGVTVPLNLSGSTNNILLTASNSGPAILGSSATGRGVEGDSNSNIGVAGFSTSSYGVYGDSASSFGVFGFSDTNFGVRGITRGAGSAGVIGLQGPNGTYPFAFAGVSGSSITGDGTGVYGAANVGSQAYGVWGVSSTGYAGFFNGRVQVVGDFTVANGSKNFIMDHPLDPANKYLQHAAVESSEMKNIYDGVATLDADGAVTVTLPDWFEALNQDFRYQLTAIGAPGPDLYIAQEIQGNSFKIAGGTPGMKVSWQLTGIRHDPWAQRNPMQVEVAKSTQERDTYLYPQGYGQPMTKAQDSIKQNGTTPSESQSEKQAKAP
jgi:hypothetical protein